MSSGQIPRVRLWQEFSENNTLGVNGLLSICQRRKCHHVTEEAALLAMDTERNGEPRMTLDRYVEFYKENFKQLQLADDLVAEVRRWSGHFDATDKNGDGVIDHDEFQELYSHLKHLSAYPAEDMWKQIDTDRDGTISRTEYLRWLIGRGVPVLQASNLPEEQRNILQQSIQYFEYFEEGSAGIKQTAFAALKADLQANSSLDVPEALDVLFREMDKDNSGAVTLGEFIEWLGMDVRGRPQPSAVATTAGGDVTAPEEVETVVAPSSGQSAEENGQRTPRAVTDATVTNPTTTTTGNSEHCCRMCVVS